MGAVSPRLLTTSNRRAAILGWDEPKHVRIPKGPLPLLVASLSKKLLKES
jgi:hypothetical protein